MKQNVFCCRILNSSAEFLHHVIFRITHWIWISQRSKLFTHFGLRCSTNRGVQFYCLWRPETSLVMIQLHQFCPPDLVSLSSTFIPEKHNIKDKYYYNSQGLQEYIKALKNRLAGQLASFSAKGFSVLEALRS